MCYTVSAHAELRLSTIFADDMILQQEANAKIWGHDAPNTKVTVKSSWGESASTKTDDNGTWSLFLHTPKADYQPQTLTISGSTKIKLNNILMGEVWLCSGQSNMSLPLTSNDNQPVENSLQDIARSNNSNLRLFTVDRTAKDVPIDTTMGVWESAHPNTTGHFSAVAYYFGRQLQEILDVPIGLIHSSWGGTAIKL